MNPSRPLACLSLALLLALLLPLAVQAAPPAPLSAPASVASPMDDPGMAAPAGAPQVQPDYSGALPWVTLLCQFADIDDPLTMPDPAYFRALMGDVYPGMTHYWREVSYGRIDLTGSRVAGWYRLPKPRSYYIYDMDRNGQPDSDLRRLFDDCTGAADLDVYFPDFYGINFVFNGALTSLWGGAPSGEWLEGFNRNYARTWVYTPLNHSTLAHEMGHGFGMLHSSYTYEREKGSMWDIMSSPGPGQPYPPFGYTAQFPAAPHTESLGWPPAARSLRVNALRQTFTLAPLSQPSAPGYLVARIPFPNSEADYYTVEARRPTGYDQYMPGSAVLIHRVIAERRKPLLILGDADTETTDAMWLPGNTFSDPERGITITVDAAAGDSYVVTVTTANPPEIVGPPADDAIVPGPVTFEWRPSARATGYQFQLDTSPAFDSPARVDLTLSETSYATAFVEHGRYYWRVRGLPGGAFNPARQVMVADSAFPIPGATGGEPRLMVGEDGRLYLFYNSDSQLFQKSSTDEGATWTAPRKLRSGAEYAGAVLTAGTGKRWWMAWAYDGGLWLAPSINEGVTWGAKKRIDGVMGAPEQPDLLHDAGGRLWLAYEAYPQGRRHIYVHRSTDGGLTWSPPARVSSDEARSNSNARLTQAGGRVVVVWVEDGRLVQRSSLDGSAWDASVTIASDAWWYRPAASAGSSGRLWVAGLLGGRVRYAHSADSGLTWSVHFPFTRYPQREHSVALATLPGGRVAAAWSGVRDDRIWFGVLGEREDTDPPPLLESLGFEPGWPQAGQPLRFTARAASASGIQKLELVWSLDGVEQPPLPLADDGAGFDAGRGDGEWFGTLRPNSGLLAYRFRLTDAAGNAFYSSATPQQLRVLAPFTRQHHLLLINDSSNEDAQYYLDPFYRTPLGTLGYQYDVWDYALRGPIPEHVLQQYCGATVLWLAATHSPQLDETAPRTLLARLLDCGGRLALTGPYVAEELAGSTLLAGYLHAPFAGGITASGVTGTAGDVIGNGLAPALKDRWTSNPAPAGKLAPEDPATVAFRYTGADAPPAAVRIDAAGYRAALFGFGIHSMQDPPTRSLVLDRTLRWLGVYPRSVRASLSPPRATVTSGRPLPLDILLDAGEQPVGDVVIELTFDPGKLQIVTPDGRPAGEIDGDTGAFATITANQVDNTNGRVLYAATAAAPHPSPAARLPDDALRVARLWVSATVPGESALAFGPLTAAGYAGQELLAGATGSTITAAAPKRYLPFVVK